MKQANPELWDEVEKKCRTLDHGEIHAIIKVRGGTAVRVLIEKTLESLQAPKKSGKEEII